MLATYPAHRFNDVFTTNGDEHSNHSLAPHQSIPVSVWSSWSAAPAFALDQQQQQQQQQQSYLDAARIPRQHYQQSPPQPLGLMSSATSSSLQQPPIRLHPSSPASFPVDSDTTWSTPDEGVLHLGQTMLPQQQRGSEGASRLKTHQRAPSNSSIASTGPASPFDGAVSHPYIVSSSDTPGSIMAADSPGFDELHQLEQVKPLPTPSHTPLRQTYLLPEGDYPVRRESTAHQRSTSLGDAPPPLTPATTTTTELPETQSRPAMTTSASSTSALDAWIGQGPSEVEEADSSNKTTVPKFQRTMTDAIEDELFQPSSLTTTTISTTPPAAPAPSTHRRTSSNNQNLLSPYRTVFNERMHAATQAHLLEARATSPATAISRERSPFRQGSPYAPSVSSFDNAPSPRQYHARLGSLSGTRSGSQVVEVPTSMDDEVAAVAAQATISPKDALLEFRDCDEDSQLPLFPPVSNSEAANTQLSAAALPSSTTSTFTFSHPAPATTVIHGLPQQYPFIPHPRREARNNSSFTHHASSAADPIPDFPAHLTSMETSVSENNDTPSGSQEMPMLRRRSDNHHNNYTTDNNNTTTINTSVDQDTGTYTCTYHGCSLRFDTPADLQRHKRDGHRQGLTTTTTTSSIIPHHEVSSPSSSSAAAAAAAIGQAGPHRCDRINPSTGRPCATIFSRPYDLTRHEDTIHNARKIKARCGYCTEEKTFSRHDALTRHMRVVHPEIEFGARARKRQRVN